MDEKRTIDEIAAIYQHETHLRDIFVEGATDKYFLEWYLSRKQILGVSVYSIDIIDIPDDLLVHYGLALDSNRSRVIALSCELDKRLREKYSVICIADRDYEDYCPSCPPNQYLTFTDGNSVELYVMTPAVIQKFLLVALGGFPMSAQTFIDQIANKLERIYAIRLANERLQWGMKWVPFKSYIDLTGGNVSFREESFLRAYLMKNDRWSQRQVFEDMVERSRKELLPDLSHKIRGHDVADIILMLLRRLRKERQFGNAETLEGCLRASLEISDLDGTELSKHIAAISI